MICWVNIRSTSTLHDEIGLAQRMEINLEFTDTCQ